MSWLAILFCVWVFVAAPTLCLGGWMGHACDDGDTRGETHHRHSENSDDDCHDDDTPAPCSHESDCGSDPCSLTATARKGNISIDSATVAFIAPLSMVATTDIRDLLAEFSVLRAGPINPGLPIPIHLSSHPLLN